jgi:hypothetical protein
VPCLITGKALFGLAFGIEASRVNIKESEAMDLGVMEWGITLASLVVAITVALTVVRVVRRTVSGCVSTGVGCFVLIIGLLAIAAFLTTGLGITNVQGLRELLSGM